jgi:hypothetical protein
MFHLKSPSLHFGGRRKKPLSKMERGWGEVKRNV